LQQVLLGTLAPWLSERCPATHRDRLHKVDQNNVQEHFCCWSGLDIFSYRQKLKGLKALTA